MRIIFMSGGAREKALTYLLEKKENIVSVVTPELTTKNSRFQKVQEIAREYGIPLLTIKKDTLEELLEKQEFDMIVSCGFPYVISKNIIKKAKYAINVHPTLLPKYRGYRSGPYILINGEKKTGVTIHFIEKEVDKGAILAQEKFDVGDFDTTKSIFRKCQQIEPALLFNVIQKLKSGRYKVQEQDEDQATIYNHLRTPKDSEIDPDKSLRELYNVIRACDPVEYPAFFYINNQKVCIKLWRPDKPVEDFDMI